MGARDERVRDLVHSSRRELAAGRGTRPVCEDLDLPRGTRPVCEDLDLPFFYYKWLIEEATPTCGCAISLFLRLRSPEGTLEGRCARRWSDLGADDQPGDILWVQRLELLEV